MQTEANNIVLKSEKDRVKWVDQLKGLAIFLMVYAHNFPGVEKFIYMFHMPLFFMIAGFFVASQPKNSFVSAKVKSLLIPYFIWGGFLFVFWWLIGKNVGASADMNLSVGKNFLGLLLAQGDMPYMDWGIPMWFLPGLFICHLTYFLISKINKGLWIKTFVIIAVSGLGYALSLIVPFQPWSIFIAWVAVIFLWIGKLVFSFFNQMKWNNAYIWAIVLGAALFTLEAYNIKVDMYRSEFGIFPLFLLNGVLGSFLAIFLVRALPKLPVIAYWGKNSLLILVFHGLAMSLIKLILKYGLGIQDFDFSEPERFIFAIIQIFLLYPVFYIVNRFVPFLNGNFKRK